MNEKELLEKILREIKTIGVAMSIFIGVVIGLLIKISLSCH